MSDHFVDGIRLEANRSNEASGRSWHIPEDREPSGVSKGALVIIGLLVALSLAASLAGML